MSVVELTHRQAWLPTPDPLLNPTSVRLERKGDTLFLEARLTDPDIHDPNAKFNDEAYQSGDVFELFIKGEGDEHYHEIHLTPGNVLLQLRFNTNATRPFDVEAAKLPEPILTTSAERFDGGWIARFELPLGNISEQRPLPTRWKVGCGRYDYQVGRAEPILSNTAPLTILDFHRHGEWDEVELA